MELMKRAENAINAVFGDTSVDRATTLERMEELLDLIQTNIAALDDEG